jgi:hypothetical protein
MQHTHVAFKLNNGICESLNVATCVIVYYNYNYYKYVEIRFFLSQNRAI